MGGGEDAFSTAAGMAGTGVGLAILGMGAGVALKSMSEVTKAAGKPRRRKRGRKSRK